MRIAPFAAVALACALAGAFLALALAKAVGWAGSDSTTTVFRSSPLPLAAGQASPVAVGPSVKPLIGNGFNPKAIYARRSPGVVTIVAVYGNDPATAERARSPLPEPLACRPEPSGAHGRKAIALLSQ